MKYTQIQINTIKDVFQEIIDDPSTIITTESKPTEYILAVEFLLNNGYLTETSHNGHSRASDLGRSAKMENVEALIQENLEDQQAELEQKQKKKEAEAKESKKTELEIKVLEATLGSNKREKLLAALVFGSLLIQIGAWLRPNPFGMETEEVININTEKQIESLDVIELDSTQRAEK